MKLRIAEIRNRLGWTQQDLADRAAVSRSHLSELETGKKPINTNRLEAVARALGVSVRDIFPDDSPPVTVAGRVGAGAEVILVDGYAKGAGLWHVERPPQLAGRSVVAVEVVGESMAPAHAPGDLLFYTREALGVPTECAGRRCVAEDAEGRAWVKILRRREGQPQGLWDLHSVNAAHPPRYDVPLVWAAPVLFHLDADYAARVEPAGE